MPHLPGALVGAGEFIGGHFVTQRRDVVEHAREGIIAEHRLVADGECVPSTLGRQQCEQGAVVDIAQQPFAVFLRIVEAQVRAEHPVAHRLAVLEAVETLVVDVFQLRIPDAHRAALAVEGVVGASIVEAIGLGVAGQLRHVAELGAHLAIAGLVEQAAGTELAGLQRQPFDLLGDETGALIGRRQQADIAEGQHRQIGRQLADLQLGFRQPRLERGTDATEVVRRFAVTAGRQQAGVDSIGAAVELDAQLTEHVDAETHRARCVA